jgi:Flp pilus assembly protein TadB
MSDLCYQLAAILLLCAFLLWKHRARHGRLSWWQRRRLEIERVEMEARLTGHGFAATEEIKARLKKVRDHHEDIARRRKTEAHGEFAASVRKSLLRLGFFGGSNDHSERESHSQH